MTDRENSTTHISVLAVLERYALLLLLILLVIVFSILPSTSATFLTSANIKNIVAQESVVAILALAALIPLVALQFDVSVGAVLGAVAILTAKLTVDGHWAVLPALVAGISLGCGVGVINGYLVAYVGANSFIITLGASTLLTGLVSLYSGDQTIVNVPQPLLNFGNGYWLGIPRPAWLLAVVAGMVAYLLRHTVFGRQLLQIGSNPRSARLVGIRVRRLMLLAFVLAGVLAAVAGALELARTGSGDPQVGSNLTLNALAACFLGSTTVRPGQFNVPGTLIGVFFVAVSVNGLTLAGVADWVDPVFNGLAVVIAVALSTVLARRRGTRTAIF